MSGLKKLNMKDWNMDDPNTVMAALGWLYAFDHQDTNGDEYYKCQLCEKVYKVVQKRRVTLEQHAVVAHGGPLKKFKMVLDRCVPKEENAKIGAFAIKRVTAPAPRASAEFSKDVAYWLVTANRQVMNLVDDEGLRRLSIKYLHMQMPSRPTVTKYADEMWKGEFNTLKGELSKSLFVSVAFDPYTLRHGKQGLSALTAAFFTNSGYELQPPKAVVRALGLPVLEENHTAAYLMSNVCGVLRDLHVSVATASDVDTTLKGPLLVSTVTDNASSVVSASDKIGNDFMFRGGCLLHMLALVGIDMLKAIGIMKKSRSQESLYREEDDDTDDSLAVKLKRTIATVSRSDIVWRRLCAFYRQQSGGQDPPRPVVWSLHRWTGLVNSLDWLVKCIAPMNDALDPSRGRHDPNIPPLRDATFKERQLTEEDYDLLVKVREPFEKLKRATIALESRQMPSGGAFFICRYLSNELHDMHGKTTGRVRVMLQAGLDSINARFPVSATNPTVYSAYMMTLFWTAKLGNTPFDKDMASLRKDPSMRENVESEVAYWYVQAQHLRHNCAPVPVAAPPVPPAPAAPLAASWGVVEEPAAAAQADMLTTTAAAAAAVTTVTQVMPEVKRQLEHFIATTANFPMSWDATTGVDKALVYWHARRDSVWALYPYALISALFRPGSDESERLCSSATFKNTAYSSRTDPVRFARFVVMSFNSKIRAGKDPTAVVEEEDKEEEELAQAPPPAAAAAAASSSGGGGTSAGMKRKLEAAAVEVD